MRLNRYEGSQQMRNILDKIFHSPLPVETVDMRFIEDFKEGTARFTPNQWETAKAVVKKYLGITVVS